MPKLIDFETITPDVPETTPGVPAVPASAGGGNTSSPPGKDIKKGKKQVNPALMWCFTLNNPVLPGDHNIFQNNPKIDKYVYQLEEGESKTPHFQGFLRFKTKSRPMSIITNPKIHWEKCKSPEDAIRYCQKPEGRLQGPWMKGIRKERAICSVNESNLRPWQKDIFDFLETEPGDRKIQWLWEDIGNFGKTQFAKFLCMNHDALYLSGKATDMKHAIVQYIETNGQSPWTIIIDIPRSSLGFVSYTGIEEIRGGIFFSGKYESAQCFFAPPHVIVFANAPPDTDKMSIDRWEITNLREKYPMPPAAESSA